MGLIFNGTEVSNTTFNGTTLDKVIFNGTTIWESGDEFIFEVTEPDVGGSHSIKVWSGNSGCDVINNGITTSIPPDTSQSVTIANNTQVTIKGSFIDVESEYSTHDRRKNIKIGRIIKWYKKLDYLFDNFFHHQYYPYDLTIPDNITKLGTAFYSTKFCSSSHQTKFNLFLPSRLEEYGPILRDEGETAVSILSYTNAAIAAPLNATLANNFIKIGDVVLDVYRPDSGGFPEEISIPNDTRLLPTSLFSGRSGAAVKKINFPTDNKLHKIPAAFVALNTDVTTISTIPASISVIGVGAFANSGGEMNIGELRFAHGINDEIHLPQAGSPNGMLYVKTARSMNIYTDNPTIAQYNYAADNITATIYHLDGTPWEG